MGGGLLVGVVSLMACGTAFRWRVAVSRLLWKMISSYPSLAVKAAVVLRASPQSGDDGWIPIDHVSQQDSRIFERAGGNAGWSQVQVQVQVVRVKSKR